MVFGEDKTHGTSRVTMVGPPAGLETLQRAVEGGQPPHHPQHAGSGARIGAATAVVADDRAQDAVLVGQR